MPRITSVNNDFVDNISHLSVEQLQQLIRQIVREEINNFIAIPPQQCFYPQNYSLPTQEIIC